MTLIHRAVESIGATAPPEEHTSGDNIGTSENGVVFVEAREGLAAITQPETELVIWERTLPTGFKEWIDRTEPPNLPNVRFLLHPDDLCASLWPILNDCGLAGGEMRDVMLGDIDRLVTAFAEITKSELVDIRLERIEHNACWKFHRDTVEARLITTYRGPTTEWVQMENAERAIDEQTDYDGPLERLGDGHVALFKGKCAGENSGIVHRSPPIEGTGCTRLLLCLNKQTVVSPSRWERN